MLSSEMSVFYMGFSLEDDSEMKGEVMAQLKDDDKESEKNLMIQNVGVNGFEIETEFDFWPIQHPTEPTHEDRPVQCPMPHSSHLINDERIQDERFSYHKKSEAKTVIHKDNNAQNATEPTKRMIRKRHHDHTRTIMPLLTMSPPIYPYSHHKTVFNKLQQIHKFES